MASTKAPAKPTPPRPATGGARRADFGAPVDGFFARQPAPLKAILDEMQALIREAAPEVTSSLKWGMPCDQVNGRTLCSLGAFKAHVNLVLWGPADSFPDPEGRLSGEGKGGRHLKLSSLDDLPRESVRAWLKAAAQAAGGPSKD
jgi:hypothetical protein